MSEKNLLLDVLITGTREQLNHLIEKSSYPPDEIAQAINMINQAKKALPENAQENFLEIMIANSFIDLATCRNKKDLKKIIPKINNNPWYENEEEELYAKKLHEKMCDIERESVLEKPDEYHNITYISDLLIPQTTRYQFCKILKEMGLVRLEKKKWIATEKGINKGLLRYHNSTLKGKGVLYEIVQNIANDWMEKYFFYEDLFEGVDVDSLLDK